ncbi:Homeobox-leucine zipper protein ROC4, partial [Linum grandiflorum]
GVIPEQPAKKRKWHRHTQAQINELQSLYAECTHPSAKQFDELSKKIGMEIRHIRYWFQNRRAQYKIDLDSHENKIFLENNNNLKTENILLRTALSGLICKNCNGSLTQSPLSPEQEQQLRLENIYMKEKINRMCAVLEL